MRVLLCAVLITKCCIFILLGHVYVYTYTCRFVCKAIWNMLFYVINKICWRKYYTQLFNIDLTNGRTFPAALTELCIYYSHTFQW